MGVRLAAQAQESLSFKVEKILLTHLGVLLNPATANHIGDLFRDCHIMVGGIALLVKRPNSHFHHGKAVLSGHADLLQGSPRRVSFHVHGQHCFFGILDEVVPVHGHFVGGSQDSELDRLRPGSGHFGQGDVLKGSSDVRHQLDLFRVKTPSLHFKEVLRISDNVLLHPASSRDQSDAHFHQAHVGFCGIANAIRSEADLTTASQSHARRGRDHRFVQVLESHETVLERLDHPLQLIPFLFLRRKENEWQVGACGEVVCVVGDHQSVKVFAHDVG